MEREVIASKPTESYFSEETNNFGLAGHSFLMEDDSLSNAILGDTNEIVPAKAEPILKKPVIKKPVTKAKPVEEEEETEEEGPDVDIAENILGEQKNIIDTEADEIVENNKKVDKEQSTFESLKQDLIKLGIFNKEETDDQTPIETGEQFKNRWFKELEKQSTDYIYNNILSTHGEEGIKMFQNIFVNGISPEQYLEQHTQVESIKDLDMTSEYNQEQVFREKLRRDGYSDETVEKKITKSKEYGDLEEDATAAHTLLLKAEQENLSRLEEEAKAAKETKQLVRKQTIDSFNKIITDKVKEKTFDGIPVTDKIAKDTMDYLLTERWQLPDGSKLTDFDKDLLELRKPENHLLKVKLGLLLKNKLDLTKVKQVAVSEKNDELFNQSIRLVKTEKKHTQIVPSKSFFDAIKQ